MQSGGVGFGAFASAGVNRRSIIFLPSNYVVGDGVDSLRSFLASSLL